MEQVTQALDGSYLCLALGFWICHSSIVYAFVCMLTITFNLCSHAKGSELLNAQCTHVRGSRQHMFLAGIWCSVKKPPTCSCLAPILEELRDLTTNGSKFMLLSMI